MELGKLTFVPASEAPGLVAEPVRPQLQGGLWVNAIDPDLADTAASLTGMEYGGITPVGLPADWPVARAPASRRKRAYFLGVSGTFASGRP